MRSGGSRIERRTFRKLRAERPDHHHNVYVVLLDPAAGRLRAVRVANPKRDPKKPCVYVGMTGLAPEDRFANHQAGVKAAGVVKRHDLRLLPELYAHLNPMPFEAAAQMEVDLAEDLRRAGYTMRIMVKGGEVNHFTANMSLPRSEFVKRTTGQLPQGAWVGSVSKLDGEVVAITSKHFFGYQLPGPPEITRTRNKTETTYTDFFTKPAVKRTFE